MAAVGDQLFVAALFEDAAAGEHDDVVRHPDGGKPVRDDDGHLVLGNFSEALEDERFGAGIHRGGRLVEHQDVGSLPHERARQRDLLPLAERELAAALEPAAELRLVGERELGDERGSHALLRGLRPARLLLEGSDVADADVLADQELVADEVLEDDADAVAERRDVPLGQVGAVEDDAAAGRFVEPGEELDERGLAGPVLSDQRQLAAGRQVEAHPLERGSIAAGIGEGDVLEADAVARLRTDGDRAARRRHLGLEQLVQVRQVQVVLVHAADGGQGGRQRRLALLEDEDVHGHVAQADVRGRGLEDDPGVDRVEGGAREEPEDEAPAAAPEGEVPVLDVEAAEDLIVAAEHRRAEAEQHHLLGRVLARDEGLEVRLLPGLRGSPAEEAERLAGEAGLGGEHRQRGAGEDSDRERREPEQERAVGDQRDDVLHQAEGAHHQAERTARGLAAGAGELVVELGVLEVVELEGERLLEDEDVDPVPELRAQERLADRDDALDGGHADDEAGLEQDEGHRARAVAVAGGGGDHGVDQPLADVGDQGRQDAGHQAEDDEEQGEEAAGGPDQCHGAAAVLEDGDEVAQPAALARRGGPGRAMERGHHCRLRGAVAFSTAP